MTLRVRIHASPLGNLFMTEIARLLQAGLNDLGAETTFVQHELPRAEAGWCNLVVAPHEFFPLCVEASEDQRLEAASHSVLVTTEQPGTQWFDITRGYAHLAHATLDINRLAVDALLADGIPAHLLRLGYHGSWDRWRGDPRRERPHDVLFMGSLTKKREEQLARLAPTLAARDTRLLIHDGTRPVTGAAPNFLTGDAKNELLASSRVLLNFHRAEAPYLEWHRLLPALANGCVVLSEEAESYAPLVPQEHFVVAPGELFQEFLTMLLATDDLRDRIATAAYRLVTQELRFTELLRPHLDVLQAAVQPLRARRPTELRRAQRRAERAAASAASADTVDGAQRLDPRLPSEQFEIPPSDPQGRLLKRALLGQARLARRLDALACRLEHGTDQQIETRETPAFAAARPDVTVILPVHNYERHVGAALRSAVASLGVAPEVIVVDDHSTDGSRGVVEEVLGERPEAAVRLLALRANLGLSAVRNLALRQARAPYVFFLDADNEVYPSGLARLRAALEESDAAVAYGMIEGFGEDRRLVSLYPWDVGRFVRGNYVDAMAMVRREIFAELGDFSLEMQDHHGGWEDYEFWLRCCDRGLHGVLVPEIVARYRVHNASMVSTVNLDTAAVFDFLRGRYPALPWLTPVETSAPVGASAGSLP